MSNETKLLPCPFCGGEAYKKISFPVDRDGLEMNMFRVGCEPCEIEFSYLWDEEKAIEAWNTRKPIDRIVEKLEKERHPEICGGWETMRIDKAIDIVKEA